MARLIIFLTAFATIFVFTLGGNYDYCDVLRKSLLFYEAQRSGNLSKMAHQILWRGDSALNDRGVYGEDLEGGYYDAGDNVKFGYPFAYTLTTLAWGLIDFHAGYEKCGLLQEGRDALLWGIWWLRKAHIRPDRLYGQVGLGQSDHNYWGRPECMTMERPAFYISPYSPGSDLAAESAAAFAAASIVFRNVDSSLATELLARARELFDLANNYRGKYSDSIADASNFYASYSYQDELVWGAAWLAKASSESWYLNLATQWYNDYGIQWGSKNYGWDGKNSGAEVLLAELTGNSFYKEQLNSYCNYLMYSQQRTPKGLVFLGRWGSLRNTANVMLICAQTARLELNSAANWVFVKQQIDYMLGDGGRSYVVGFGYNWPKRPHHRSSSCHADPCWANTCNWYTFSDSCPNPNTLFGALVGGPDEYDYYEDRRDDAVQNEVAIDYNAAFQGVVAALAARN